MQKIFRVNGPGAHSFSWVVDEGTGPYKLFGDGPDHPGAVSMRTRARASSLRESIKSFAGDQVKTRLTHRAPGAYHPRIWRPHCWPTTQEHFRTEWSSSVLGAQNLFEDMKQVFRYVEPTKANWSAFGHEIRQLLILACTEVETQCKAVLRANHYVQQPPKPKPHAPPIAKPRPPRDLAMGDYFRLAGPMRLAAWQGTPRRYPELGWIRPFRKWGGSVFSPLPWYSAYNATKHDREIAFSEGTLGNVIEALVAVYVLVVAQYGQFGYRTFRGSEETEFGCRAPAYPMQDHYVPPHVAPGSAWRAEDCPL